MAYKKFFVELDFNLDEFEPEKLTPEYVLGIVERKLCSRGVEVKIHTENLLIRKPEPEKMKICGRCREQLHFDNKKGWVHQDGSTHKTVIKDGEKIDDHCVLPVDSDLLTHLENWDNIKKK